MKANDVQIGGGHYRRGKIQPWDAMTDWMTPEEFKGFLRGCVIKRLQRLGHKDDTLIELQKAHHELGKLIEVVQQERKVEEFERLRAESQARVDLARIEAETDEVRVSGVPYKVPRESVAPFYPWGSEE